MKGIFRNTIGAIFAFLLSICFTQFAACDEDEIVVQVKVRTLIFEGNSNFENALQDSIQRQIHKQYPGTKSLAVVKPSMWTNEFIFGEPSLFPKLWKSVFEVAQHHPVSFLSERTKQLSTPAKLHQKNMNSEWDIQVDLDETSKYEIDVNFVGPGRFMSFGSPQLPNPIHKKMWDGSTILFNSTREDGSFEQVFFTFTILEFRKSGGVSKVLPD